jgi:hypothetical protein
MDSSSAIKKNEDKPDMVVYACNPSIWEDH